VAYLKVSGGVPQGEQGRAAKGRMPYLKVSGIKSQELELSQGMSRREKRPKNRSALIGRLSRRKEFVPQGEQGRAANGRIPYLKVSGIVAGWSFARGRG
jgi:hypothetical protein